jgi:hypothetical protein
MAHAHATNVNAADNPHLIQFPVHNLALLGANDVGVSRVMRLNPKARCCWG